MIVILLLLSAVGCDEKPAGVDETGTHTVALYSDRGTDGDCVKASKYMFQWIGYEVTQVNAYYIMNVGLEQFDILCVPGGNMYQYAQDLSSKGRNNIRNYVYGGGGYIGICGGAYYACTEVEWLGQQLPMTPLGLFSGRAVGPVESIFPYPEYGMCRIDIVNTTHRITQSMPDSAWMMYYWGPAFEPDQAAGIDILGVYDPQRKPCILAFEYGKGNVFLIGTHPEFEEDSDRDSVSFGDEFEDRGSDWELMKEAVRWCSR